MVTQKFKFMNQDLTIELGACNYGVSRLQGFKTKNYGSRMLQKASRLLPVYKTFLLKSSVDFAFVFPAVFFQLFSFSMLSLFYFIYRDLSYNEIEHLPQSCCNASNIL